MKRILVVDHDPDVLWMLALRAAGYAVDTATNLQDARRYLDDRYYDLVVGDGRLADGDGIILAAEAKRKGLQSTIIAGDGADLSAPDVAQFDVLVEPLRAHELVAEIRRRIGPPQERS